MSEYALTILQRLYDASRWDKLVRSFRTAIYNLNTIPTEPLLHLALYAGLVALKLPACYDPATKNVDCPVCESSGPGEAPMGLGKLAEEVPFSHHSNSTIVCRITGKIMNGDNPPMAFPNGRVYSREVSDRLGCSTVAHVSDRLWRRWRQRPANTLRALAPGRLLLSRS